MQTHPLGHAGLSFKAAESVLDHFEQTQDASRSHVLAGQTSAVEAEFLTQAGNTHPHLGKEPAGKGDRDSAIKSSQASVWQGIILIVTTIILQKPHHA